MVGQIRKCRRRPARLRPPRQNECAGEQGRVGNRPGKEGRIDLAAKPVPDQYRSLDPVALLAEIRATQEELGNRVDRRAGQARGLQRASTSNAPAAAAIFAKTLGKTVKAGEPRATHRRSRRPYKTRIRMPSKLDPHIATIEGWLAAQPQLTALAIVGRLIEKSPEEFGTRQHSI